MSNDVAPPIDNMYPHWTPHTIWSRFGKSCMRFADREFFVFESGSCSYRQAFDKARQTAKALLALGVGPGDHVALLMHNCPEFIILTFALTAIGAVKVPIHAKISGPELHYVLKHTDVTFLFSEKLFPAELYESLDVLRGVIVTNCTHSPRHRELSYSQFLANAAAISDRKLQQVSDECQDPYAVSDIMYTSGSTSKPKGVLITHDMLLRSSFASCRSRFMEEGRRIFVPIPLFHLMAYNEALLAALYMGETLIMTNQRYDVPHCLDMMRMHRANDIVCVFSIMVDLLTKGTPVASDFPDMQHAYWASACPDWVWRAGREAFGLQDVKTGYGMTERASTSTMISVTDPTTCVEHCHGRLKNAGAAGVPEWGGHLLQLKICDEKGLELSAGECGEIYCRGPVVTKGYYKSPETTARAFTADGWFRTGDLGSLDEEGFLTFTGRNSDMYKINGENVSPQFVDCVIGMSPHVNAVETVGIGHPKYGEIGVAFVEPVDYEDATKEAIRRYCDSHLAKFQVPRYFIFSCRSEWSRTGSGKVKKSKLREIAADIIEKF